MKEIFEVRNEGVSILFTTHEAATRFASEYSSGLRINTVPLFGPIRDYDQLMKRAEDAIAYLGMLNNRDRERTALAYIRGEINELA